MHNITNNGTSKAGELDADEKWLERYIHELHNKYAREYQDLENIHVDLLIDRSVPHHAESKGFMRGLLSPFTFYPHTRFTPPNFYIDSDFTAILHDWAIVGSDLEAAIVKYSNMCSTSVKQPADSASAEFTKDSSSVG